MKLNAYMKSSLLFFALAFGFGIHDSNAEPNAQKSGNSKPFKFTISTDDPSYDESTGFLVDINSGDNFPIHYDLDCDGDGKYEYIGLTESHKCMYKKNSGKHQIRVRGDIPAIRLCKDEEPSRNLTFRPVVSVDDWGSIEWKSMESFAKQCQILTKLPKNPPNLREVTSMKQMFMGALAFNQPIGNWDVSNVTNMSWMFSHAESFNQPLEKWNVSNVTTMRSMFNAAKSFNQPLEKWNVSRVNDMAWLFLEAYSFNQPLEKWDVSNVKNMSLMFSGTKAFNQPLEKWNVSHVENMRSMFSGAKVFNQPLEKWDVSHVETMESMFAHAEKFNQPLEKWDISNVKNRNAMFDGASSFNQPLEKWNNLQTTANQQDTKPIEERKPFKFTITTDEGSSYDETNGININIHSLDGKYPVKYDLDCEGDGNFELTGLTESHKCIYKKNSGNHQIWVRGDIPAMQLCSSLTEHFNEEPKTTQPVISIDDWGDISWKSMKSFAFNCKILNQIPKDAPNLSQVKDMRNMFAYAESFNQPLEHWNVSEVTDMRNMFWTAKSFNQPLEKWDVSRVTDMNSMFASAESFNQPLEKWNVSKVRSMGFMFAYTNAFNQPLEKWDVSSVNEMLGMFSYTLAFNQPLEKWDVSHLVFWDSMFECAKAFNQPLKKWKFSNHKMDVDKLLSQRKESWCVGF